MQTPLYRFEGLDDLEQTPVHATTSGQTELLTNLASTQRTVTTAIVNHYNVQPVFDVFADADRRDLGGVTKEIQKITRSARCSKKII